jgi:hypothetical protein
MFWKESRNSYKIIMAQIPKVQELFLEAVESF